MSVIYEDKYIVCDDEAVTINGYYFPFGSKRIAYKNIRSIRESNLDIWEGKLRLWGMGLSPYWFHLDPNRPWKTKCIIIDEGEWIKSVITPEDPNRVLQILQQKTTEIEIESDDYLGWYNRGNTLLESERYSEAIASYDKVLAIEPNYHHAWHNRGMALGNLQRYSEAIVSYDKALIIEPMDDRAWYNRGNALLNLERYSLAIASYEKALKIQPELYQAWHNRGIALATLERYSLAIASFDKAIEINPDFSMAIDSRQELLNKLGDDGA